MEDVIAMIGGFKFNYRAAAIFENGDKILLHKNADDDFYAIPGGRIQAGEPSVETLKREVQEEMGKEIDVVGFRGMVENFFEYSNKKYHEVMVIHSAKFKDESLNEVEKIVGLEDDGKLEFIWKTREEIKDLDLRPVSIKNKIINNEEIGHIINID